MKTVKTMLVALISIFAVSTTIASGVGGLKVSLMSGSGDATAVEISSVAISHIEIDVSNEYGDNLYSMKTDAPINNFKKKFDFSDLEDGTYQFSVKIDKESTVKTFEIENGVVEITDVRKSIEPYFIFKNDMLKFTYLNPQLENVSLVVYDSKNRIVAQSELGNSLAITNALDFEGQLYGDYEVVISNDMEVYDYTVSIR